MKIKTHEDLEVYQIAFKCAMEIFELSKNFPKEERYALTDQIHRSSRSVCANLAEAWRQRRWGDWERRRQGDWKKSIHNICVSPRLLVSLSPRPLVGSIYS